MADPIDDLGRVRRFLMLGTDGPTYFTDANALKARQLRFVLEFARNRSGELVRELRSAVGRAPRPDPALFALAAACSLGDDGGCRAGLDALPFVARDGAELLTFARYVERFRGWGRGLRRAVAGWYLDKPVTDVARQVVTHRGHRGWAHRDLVRLAHPATDDDARHRLFRWILGHDTSVDGLGIVEGYHRARTATTARAVADLVLAHGLPWHLVPHRHLDEPVVWEALLVRGVPFSALLSQLPRLDRLGLVRRNGTVTTALTDRRRMREERVHPLDVLIARRAYTAGGHDSRPVLDALDAGFRAALDAVEPTGRRLLVALDPADTMIPGLPLSCRDVAAALALVTAATEPAHEIATFSGHPPLSRLPVKPRRGLAHAIRAVSRQRPGWADPAQPIRHALDEGLEVDTFVVYTDDKTWWAGEESPRRLLRTYREKAGIDARLVVVAMTAKRVSVADFFDPGMLDVAGFDTTVPALVADFARGWGGPRAAPAAQ